MDGFLSKKGGSGLGSSTFKLGRKNWLERYFLLEKTTLSYFEPSFDGAGRPAGKARGTVELLGAEVADLPDAHGKEHLFWIKPSKDSKELILRAEDAAQKRLWVEALEYASHGHVPNFGPRRRCVDTEDDYYALGLATPGVLVTPSMKASFSLEAIQSAYAAAGPSPRRDAARASILYSRKQREDAKRHGACTFRGLATKSKDEGLGLRVVPDKVTGQLKLSAPAPLVFPVKVHDHSPGVSKWLQSAPVAFLKGDVLVGVGDDDISNWPKERVLSRLGDRRVRVGDTVAILVSRPALLDAYWDERPSTLSAPSPSARSLPSPSARAAVARSPSARVPRDLPPAPPAPLAARPSGPASPKPSGAPFPSHAAARAAAQRQRARSESLDSLATALGPLLVVWASSTNASAMAESAERRLGHLLASKGKRYETVYLDIAPRRRRQLEAFAGRAYALPCLSLGDELLGAYETIQELEDEGLLAAILAPAEDGDPFMRLPSDSPGGADRDAARSIALAEAAEADAKELAAREAREAAAAAAARLATRDSAGRRASRERALEETVRRDAAAYADTLSRQGTAARRASLERQQSAAAEEARRRALFDAEVTAARAEREASDRSQLESATSSGRVSEEQAGAFAHAAAVARAESEERAAASARASAEAAEAAARLVAASARREAEEAEAARLASEAEERASAAAHAEAVARGEALARAEAAEADASRRRLRDEADARAAREANARAEADAARDRLRAEAGAARARAADATPEVTPPQPDEQLLVWCNETGLENYVDHVLAVATDIHDLLEMTDDDADELIQASNMPRLKARRFKKALAKLGAPVRPAN